jgi:hypothetical protein
VTRTHPCLSNNFILNFRLLPSSHLELHTLAEYVLYFLKPFVYAALLQLDAATLRLMQCTLIFAPSFEPTVNFTADSFSRCELHALAEYVPYFLNLFVVAAQLQLDAATL